MIDILLASYNGEKYIAEQISSLLRQNYDDFNLLIRDDGSTDRTTQIVRRFAKSDKRIEIIEKSDRNRGVSNNFHALLEKSSAEYAMFCDQDDVWLPEKLERTIFLMKRFEQKYPEMPLLIHSNKFISDKNLYIVGLQHRKVVHITSEKILAENCVTGATIMVNRRLKNLLLLSPEFAVLYDWKAALTAHFCGKIGYISQPLSIYRQHSDNLVGINGIPSIFAIKGKLSAGYLQAAAFLKFYSKYLPLQKRVVIGKYADFARIGKLTKIKRIVFDGYRKSTLSKVAAQIFFC